MHFRIRPAVFAALKIAEAEIQIRDYGTQRVGLLATNSIRGGANRKVLNEVQSLATIYEAWDDEPWVVEGAAVRVSLVCFASPTKVLPIAICCRC